MGAIAALRLDFERGWEGLGLVNAAIFRIKQIDFALSQLEAGPRCDAFVGVSRAQTDADEAPDVYSVPWGSTDGS